MCKISFSTASTCLLIKGLLFVRAQRFASGYVQKFCTVSEDSDTGYSGVSSGLSQWDKHLELLTHLPASLIE